MLQIIRDRAQGVFAWIIVGMISIPFALWGINSYFGGGGDDSIAEVDGVKISSRQLQSAYQQQRDRLQQMFGGKIPENLFSEEVMKRQVLQQLIEKEILIGAAAANGMRIGDKQLRDLVTGIDAFQTGGKFDPAQYERILAQQGMSPRLFEQRVRRDLIANQLTDAVTQSEFTLESELAAQLRLQLQQRDIGYMVLPVSKFESGIMLSDEELQQYYETNRGRYMQPEQVKIDYLELKAADIAATMVVSEEELQQRYETQKLNYRTPEERKASHILLQLKDGASAQEVADAQAKAESLLQRINSGESFAEIAKAESQDPGSARNGGDLGFFGRGVMDKAFEAATFALQPGEVSGLVRSAFGFHIIKLQAVKGGETKPYAEVAAELKRDLQHERAMDIYNEQAEQLATLTYEQPDTLNAAAEQLQLTIKTSDFFGRRGGTAIAAETKVAEAAFSEDVLVRGNNSETIDLGDNHLVVLRVKEHQPEALRPFDEVKGEVEAALRRDKARTMALDEAGKLFAKMQSGESPELLASAMQLEWKRQPALQRDDTQVDSAIVKEAFRMPYPATGQFNSQQLSLPGGDQALLALYAVKQGDEATADEKLRSDTTQRIERANSNAAEQALITGLRERAEISTKQ